MTRINPARRLLSLLCVFAMAITMVVVAPAQVAYGAITSPILEISSPQDFKNFADTVNNPDTCDDYVGKTVVLTKDIDLSKDPDTADWTDIVPGIYKDYAFRGTFDGQGHTISGLYVNRTELLPQIYYPYTQSSSYSPAALFGFIGQGAVLRNFIVQGEVTSTIGTAAGVAAGLSNTGIIEYVGNEVNVTSGPDNGAAGISVPSSTSTYDERVGVFTMYGGNVRYCYNTGTITGGKNTTATNILNNYGAGIYGNMRGGTVTGCINYGDVSASAHAGGIVGGGTGSYGVTIINCINFGGITRIGNNTGLQCGAILGDTGTVTSSADNFYYKYKPDIFGFGVANGGTTEGVRWIGKTDTDLQDSQFVTAYNDVRTGTDPKTAIVEGDTWPVLAWVAAAKPLGAPVITAQPNDVWKVAPEAASLSVTFALPAGSKAATNGAITKVEWYSNTTESNVGGTQLATDDNSSAGFGAGGISTYAIPTTTVGSYYYYCVITNAWGTSDSAVVVSRPVRLFVTDPADAPTTPVITTNPDNLVLLEFSTGNTLSVAVDNTSYNGVLTYQWYANSDASNVGGSKIKFATDATYEPPTTALGTINYYCVATNTTDGISTAIATSAFAAVRVHGIEVSTAAELLAIQQAVANGKNYAGLHIELIADIDLSTNLIAAAWEPIGRDSSYPFNGLFLGHGKTISGLNITNYEGPYAGLFGYVGSGAVIQDLVVKGNITDDGSTYNAIGGVVGYIAGTSAAPVVLSNIGSEVNVDSISNSYNLTVGGLVGAINTYGSIANSYHRGNVAGSYRVGGLAGSIVANAASLNLSYNQGSVQLNSNVSDSDAAVGGLAGYTTRGLLNSYNTATVSAPSGSKIGALVGYGADTAQPGTTGSSNDYYLAGVSGTPDVDFLTNSAAKTDAELKDAAFITAINAGTSAFVAGDNGGYPKLSWEGVVSTTVDSSLLQAKLSEASTIQLDVKVSDDGTDIDPAFEWVSQTVVYALQKVIADAGLAFNDPNPTQTQIDAVLVRLSNAVIAYNAAKQQGTLFIPVNPVDEDWRQLAGGGRYSTMKSIILDSGAFTDVDTDTVIVATGRDFPDALAANSLAGVTGAPVVLTASDALSTEARDVILALNPSKIYIVGGLSAISQDVEDSLKALVADVRRASGSDRSATALDIYAKAKDAGQLGSTAVIANGYGFADALSISPYVFAEKAPVFLSDPVNGLSLESRSALRNAIKNGEVTRVVIVGGVNAVPNIVKTQVGFSANDESFFVRLGAGNRYKTSSDIALWIEANSANLGFHNIAVATGQDFPDALAGGAFAGKIGTVLLLVDDSADGKSGIDTVIAANKDKIGKGHALGGDLAVSSAMRTILNNASKD